MAAICAAPIALKAHRVFEGRQMTSHPSVRAMLEDWGESAFRQRQWMSVDAAIGAVTRPELRRVLERFAATDRA